MSTQKIAVIPRDDSQGSVLFKVISQGNKLLLEIVTPILVTMK